MMIQHPVNVNTFDADGTSFQESLAATSCFDVDLAGYASEMPSIWAVLKIAPDHKKNEHGVERLRLLNAIDGYRKSLTAG